MSKGFRSADDTQVLTEQATAAQIEEILRQDREQEFRSAERRRQGTYGTCEDCGGPIGQERLAALPSATRCVPCQASWEAANPTSHNPRS
jgi:RNA polymerase-binding transcription factor